MRYYLIPIFIICISFSYQQTFGQAEDFLNIFPQREQVGTEWKIELTGAVNSDISPKPDHSLSQTYTKKGEYQDQIVEVLLMQFKSPADAKIHYDNRVNSIIQQGGYKEFNVDSVNIPCYGVFVHQNEKGEGSGIICINDNIVFVTLVDSQYTTVDTTNSATRFTQIISKNLGIDIKSQTNPQTKQVSGGGCLIATATYGSELAPQVQQLRELRDNSLLQTELGTSFMAGFNQFYYSFSPQIADWERENPVFKEAVKITLTPMISSLSILNYVDMDSESSVLGYGISLIILNAGMYFVAPAIVIHIIRKKV